MKAGRPLVRCAAALAIAAASAAPAGAATLVRADLELLTAVNGTIVVGEALDASSYWNDDGTLILTDVRVSVIEVVKGTVTGGEMTVTLVGGDLDGLALVVPGGARLMPGKSYVLFLNREDLPGARGVRTVRDHSQGVFELVVAGEEVRAVSQANGHPLVADAFGRSEAPGGVQGIPIDDLVQTIRELANRRPGLPRR